MAWSKKQIILHIRACKAAGIIDEYRKLILRQVPNAMFDRDGKISTEPSSTSKKLNNCDFEQVMAIIEGHCGGRIKGLDLDPTKPLPDWHWKKKAKTGSDRMIRKVLSMAASLEKAGYLEPVGVGLHGWIEKRVTKGETDDVHRLSYEQLHALINGLRDYARRHGIKTD